MTDQPGGQARTDLRYRDATPDDAGTLARLFSDVFTETFGHLYDPADLEAFLAGHRAEHWAEQLRDPRFTVRIAEDGGQAVGLAKLGPLKLPVEGPIDPIELRQLYVAARARGTGVAAGLMSWVLEEAERRGARELYLSVYTDNVRAQRFYARYGFEVVGPCVFMVGNQADADIIIKRPIQPSQPRQGLG